MANPITNALSNPDVLSALIGAGGSLLEGVGQAGESKEQRQQQQRQIVANYLAGLGNQDRGNAAAAAGALNGPYGTNEALQRQLTRRDLLSSLQNAVVTPPPDIAPYTGSISGGPRIPEGGLNLAALSDDALAESARGFYSNLATLNPRVQGPDLAKLGLGASGAASSASTEGVRQGTLRGDEARHQQIMDLLVGSGPIGTPEKPRSGGFLSGLKKVLGVAAPIAASFIPGVGPIASMLIGAGANAGATKLGGGSWRDAAISGALGGVTAAATSGSNRFRIPRRAISYGPVDL